MSGIHINSDAQVREFIHDFLMELSVQQFGGSERERKVLETVDIVDELSDGDVRVILDWIGK